MSSFYSPRVERGNINNIGNPNQEAPANELTFMDEMIETRIMAIVKSTVLSNMKYNEILPKIHKIVIYSAPYEQNRNSIRGTRSQMEFHLSIPNMRVPFRTGIFPNLEMLRVSSANLDYEFNYSEMQQLREFSIENNQGSVQFTDNIRLLKKLETLELIDCNLTSIPNGITELKHLKKLNLMSNLLTDLPPELDNMTKLTTVIIENNEFDTFPPCLGNSHIRALRIGKNNIRDFPAILMKKMVDLQILNIDFMKTDYIENPLVPICNLGSLRIFSANFVKGITEIPSQIGNLTELLELHMVDAYDLRDIHKNIGKLDKMLVLNISHCGVVSLPKEFGNLKKLINLILTNKPVSPADEKLRNLPREFGELKALTKLSLMSAELDEDDIRHISNLHGLKHLEMVDCGLTRLPNDFAKLKHLEHLTLLDNKLTTLPENIGSLKKLKSLNLQTNQLSVLPNSFVHLSALETLYIDENQLTDLPIGFANLPRLHTLYMGHNRLGNRMNEFMMGLLRDGNETIRFVNVISNGTRFQQDVINRIEAFNEAGRVGINTRIVSYIDEFDTDNPNIIPGFENAVAANPAEQAMEIHREFDRINRDELLEVLGGLKIYPKEKLAYPKEHEDSFNSMLYGRIKLYLGYFKEKDLEQHKQIMDHLATLENKIQFTNFTDNVDTLNLFYTALEYVEQQPNAYKAYYAYNYVLSNALAYCDTMADRTSCTLGLKERIVMDLASGTTGLDEKDVKPEYIELARIIQQDKIPAIWINIEDLKVKKTKLNSFAKACISDEEHLAELKQRQSVEMRKEYVMRCITDKIVDTFTDENDQQRFKGANPPKVVRDYVNTPFIEEMLSDDMLLGGRRRGRDRERKMTRRHRGLKIVRKTGRNGGKSAVQKGKTRRSRK